MLKKLLILFLLPFLLCSCSKDNREIITFSSWGSVTETTILRNLIKDFEKQTPNIKVNFMHIPQNYFQKLQLLFASSTPPDVIFINNLYLPVFANELEDLSNLVNKENFYTQTLETLSVNNHILAVPRDISNFVFYYNKKYIPNISVNWNFHDFEKIIHKYKQKNVYTLSYERDILYAEPYIMTLGYNEGLKFYKKLEGTYAPTPAQIGSATTAQMFLDGKIMLYFSGRWMYPKIKENANFEWGVVPFPGISSADASGWAISKKSKHKDAAKEFVQYISSAKSIEYMAQTGLIIPARTGIKFDDSTPYIKAIERSNPHLVDKNYRKIRDKMNKELFY